MGITRDKSLQVRTSFDNMEAFLTIPIPGPEQPDYTITDLKDYLEVKGIKYGIDEEMLKKMVEGKIYEQERRVAVGTKPVEGRDGEYEFFFNRAFDHKPKELPDGSVDYYNVNLIATVAEGDKVAEYHPAIEGHNGMNVKGALLTCKRCRDLPPLKGKGFARSEDGNSYFAESAGKIDYTGDRLVISALYEIQGNTDLKTGNIDFIGDVVIHGMVKSGMSIRATGTVTIDGVVEGASIDAGKDIVLKSGLMGNNSAIIKCKGNLFAKFVEYASLDIRGSISAEVLLNCDVMCGEKVIITGKKGSIVGGYVQAISGVEANFIGNEMEVKTQVCVGAEVEAYRRVKVLEHKIEAAQKNMELIDEKIRVLEEAEKQKTVMDKQKADPRKVSLLRMKIRENSMLSQDKMELEELESIVQRAEGAKVTVFTKVFPGVTIRIDDSVNHVKEEQVAVQFVKYTESVRMERIVDAVF